LERVKVPEPILAGTFTQVPSGAVEGQDTFRLPSTALFLGLLPVFSGQARRSDLAAELLDGRPRVDRKGRLRSTQVRTYIVYNGRESQARTSVCLFHEDPMWQEGELSGLIKRQFGSAGLKHLLGVLISAEELGAHREESPSGGFVFDVNKHLDVLGYKRSNRINGKAYHTTKNLAEAREIVALLCSLTLVQEIRLGTNHGSTVKVRLLLDDTSAQSWEEPAADSERLRERITTNERFYLRINPQLFSLAAEGTRSQQSFYTHQLRKLARENARTQSLTLTLGVHLPIKFRMHGCMPLRYTARSFLRMAGIVEEEYTAYEMLERVERSMRYMVDQGYVGTFETERYRYGPDELPHLSDGVAPPNAAHLARQPRWLVFARPPTNDPLDEMWTVEAPEFLLDILRNTFGNRAAQDLAAVEFRDEGDTRRRAPEAPQQAFLPGMGLEGPPPHLGQLLRQVREKLGLSQGQLAKRLDVTQAAISMAEAGKRPQMARRLLDAARRLA